MDEQPVVEQENDVNDSNGAIDRLKDPALSTGGAEPGEFDPEQFASLMQKELIAYNFSWDPLLKALQALRKSMARQQKAQKSNNGSMEEIHDQIGSLRDQLSQVQSEKDAMGTTLATLKDQMEAMQAQMEKLQQDYQGRDSNAANQSNNESGANSSKGDDDGNPASSDSQNPFVTTKDLAKAKKDLSKHLRRSLTEAFGDEVNDDDAEGDDEDVHEGDNGAGKADGNSPTTEEGETKKARTSFKRPGAPFASDAMVKQEIARLEQLQDALNDKLAAHDLQLESLLGKIGDLDAKSDELASHLGTNGDGGNNLQTPRQAASSDGDGDGGSSSGGLTSDALLKELSELKAVQDSHAQLLKDQHQAVGKNASDIKALVASLDDLAIQQQTAASLFESGANQASGASDGTADSRAGARRTSDGGNPQLDLSLVFTKIADLRRSTDASLDSLQKNINEVSNATNTQQAQLDALRNGLVFNEHQRLHMIESRLAMQKELLDRNQTHQDRTKPQLAEWRKALELNDEKLTQGLCDEEILQELQQLQRHYRRTYLSFSPLINSPLTIAESLQVLAEEVKQFQNGVKAGVVPLRGSNESTSNSSGGSKKNEREEEFTKKLRYLDEEVDATLQVNVVTEKKNDPLIKSLDAMREKLESLSSMWYRNYTQRKRASRGQDGGNAQGSITDSDCTPRSASGDYDGLREVELRLMGAVRRLGMVEEDVERLNSLSAINASEMSSAARAAAIAAANNGGSNARMKSESDDLGKLRKEVYAEIAKLTAHLGNLQLLPSHHQGNSTALVPLSGSASSQLAGSRSASHVSQNDLVKELYSQMKGRELDGRFQEKRDDEVQKQLYDNFLKEVTKKVTHAVLNAEKNGGGVGGRMNGVNAAGAGAAGNNVNYRLMLENFTQKVEDRLEDARETTAEELLRMKKELADQLKIKIDLALRELRSELMLFPADTGDSTAMGTKPVMCVACSRPVPVSGLIREAGSLPPAELQAEAHSPPHNHSLQPDYPDYERNDDEFVYRAGFQMPVNDRKTMTLPFLSANMRNKMVLNKPEGRRKRPARQSHNVNRVDTVIREPPIPHYTPSSTIARREKAEEEEGEEGEEEEEEEEEAVADLHGMREQDLDRTDYSVTSSTTPSKSSSVSGRAGCGAIAEEFGGLQEGPELDFEEECADSDILDDPDGEMTIMNDDDELADDDEEEVMEHSISFQVSRATVTRSGLLPCCVFVGRVTWGTADWEIYFGQKQLLRLHINLYIHQLMYRHKLMRDVSLPWTIWREKRAERRVADVHIVQHYIRTLLKDRDLRNSEPLLAFLEVSPSRAMSRYGPSLKEGYVHMRMNGPFQLPLYTCFNRTIESLYRHLYRTWMRIAYVSAVVGVMAPLFLIIITNLGTFFSPQKQLISKDGDSVSTKLNVTGVFIGLFSLAGIIFCVAFVYKFFDHRLGVIRRWVVLKPSCFAAYRNRSDREPSEVFLFDKSFAATKGSYRQGVSWMPSGLVVGSKAGFIEIDTGHYYTRLTAFVSLALVCWGIMKMSRLAYDFEEVNIPVTNGVSISSVAEMSNWTTTTLEEERYCGYFFEVPEGKSIYARPIDSEAIVSQLGLPTNDTFTSNVNYFWQSSEVAYNLGVITNSIGSGRIVGVAKKVNPATDVFLPSNYAFEIPDVGNITITGLQGTNLLQYHAISHFCEIPIKVAPVNWSTLWRYLLLLFVGGIVAPSSGLLVNYIITYLGLWHAHVRRDHWYRCVRRLQKLKRQETEYRYHSFAPERVSSLGEAFQKNHMTSFAKLGAVPAAASGSKSRQNSDSDSSDIDSKGSTQSGGSYSAVPGPPSAVAWHVDGEDTYEAMYKAISNAKYEILIAGWWVCPDVFLLRPGRKLPERGSDDAKKTNETQLRNLLLLKAQAGVKIYVLIYREVKLALTLNSSYSKRSLLVHPNIRVLRDPIFQIQSLGFWSHHEKIVCVDQSLAFVGGLDLCFGRYDHSGHPLSDPGGDKLQDQTWPGKDYSNPIIKDFVRVNQPFEDLIDRPSQPRMPWHDVHCSVSGPPVQDIAYHFIQRWNFVCSKNDYQLRTGWCICLRSRRFKFLPKCLVPMDFNGWKLRYPSSDTSLQTVPATAIPLAHNDSCDIEPFDVMAPNTMPTSFSPGFMAPWGNGSGGTTSFGSDIPMQAGPPLSETLGETEILRAQRGESILQVFHPNAKVCNVQVCRSVSMWSAGVPTEASIQEAYIDIITKSKHFIYIENQFFISGVNSNGVVSNRILQALVDRIERAVKANEVFRVYVVMPLLPAFEGNIRSEELTNLHAVMHWQFATISRGKYSLFAALENVTNKPENYVSFFGLRKYGILPNGCVSTEQIYIHSKLLIADDMYAILGSANINDRSMMGDRDSEIAVIIEDMQFQDGVMNEKPHRRGVVVSALRLQLFREHLGLADSDDTVLDPTSEHTWLQIRGVGQQNTKIYETVFDCAPSNKMRAFTSFQNIEISQIYENQRLNVLKVPGRHHVWDKENLKEGDYSPWTDVNGVPIPPEKFNLEEDYVLDNVKDKKKKHLFSMDNDGWCYARNFSIFQEVRTGKTDFKKREKLQHFMTDRLMAQVRRRRWVKKGTMALAAMSRYSSVSESDDEEHNRFISLWRRFQNGEFSRANSLTLPPRDHSRRPSISSSAVMSGDASYPNSPMMSSFRRTPLSPMSTIGSRRNSLVHGRNGINTRASTFGGTNNSVIGNSHESDARLQDQHHEDRGSVESVGKGLGQSLRKWYSAVDLDFGRRSKFNAEYFDQDSLTHTPHIIGDEPLLESGRGSLRSIKSGRGEEDERASNELGECQIGHVQTAATVPKEGETRARLQLSEIRGHLVEFPLDFLVEEILKPSIMPSDIHI